ncbi:hypothetical protein D3C72_2099930 [compost metagenome]
MRSSLSVALAPEPKALAALFRSLRIVLKYAICSLRFCTAAMFSLSCVSSRLARCACTIIMAVSRSMP